MDSVNRFFIVFPPVCDGNKREWTVVHSPKYSELRAEVSVQKAVRSSAVTILVAIHLMDGVSNSTKCNAKQEKTLFDNVF